MGNQTPLAMMVCAHADSFTPTRHPGAVRPYRSVDVGPTVSPSCVVFAIVGRFLRVLLLIGHAIHYGSLAMMAQA